MADHCDCCLLRLAFGPRRKRVLLLLVHHPELDREDWRGVLLAETERGGHVRGHVTEKVLLPSIDAERPVA